jgi:hypothetical protein
MKRSEKNAAKSGYAFFAAEDQILSTESGDSVGKASSKWLENIKNPALIIKNRMRLRIWAGPSPGLPCRVFGA